MLNVKIFTIELTHVIRAQREKDPPGPGNIHLLVGWRRLRRARMSPPARAQRTRSRIDDAMAYDLELMAASCAALNVLRQ